MNVDRELNWQVLSSEWQALERTESTSALEKLATRVRARGRLLAWWVAGECAIAVVAIAVLVRLAINADSLPDRLAMWSFAGIAVATTTFAIWNWRGAWRPVTASQQAYVDLSMVRCARMRRASTAGYWVLAAEVACFVPWIAAGLTTAGAGARGYIFAYAYLSTFVAGALVALHVLRRWVAREEQSIRAFSDAVLNEV